MRAGEYEAKKQKTKKNSKAEQNPPHRKARAKASPTELSSSDLSCSICNRQFRAKIGKGGGGREKRGRGTGKDGAGIGRFWGRGYTKICCILLILLYFMYN